MAWIVTSLPTIDVAMVRQEVFTTAGGAPLIFVGLALLGALSPDVSVGERLGIRDRRARGAVLRKNASTRDP